MNLVEQADEQFKFSQWMAAASPNDKFEYCRGFGIYGSIAGRSLRDVVWDAAVKGEVYLVQKKYGDVDYGYIAIKAAQPSNPRLVPCDEPLFVKDQMRASMAHQRKKTMHYASRKSITERVAA